MVKGPKYMNPADKARREARKKELKKNKKQRQQVRSAAIEGRDPEQIIAELEALDGIEFDVAQLNKSCSESTTKSDILYKEKRKRLMELYEKILLHYQKEDPDRYGKLKSIQREYEAKHRVAESDFEAVKAAQEVRIEDVILPPEPDEGGIEIVDEISDDDPLMSESIYILAHQADGAAPAGCPPGPPPDLEQLVESVKNSLSLPSSIQMPQHSLEHFVRARQVGCGEQRPRFASGHVVKLAQQQQQLSRARNKFATKDRKLATQIELKSVVTNSTTPQDTTSVGPSGSGSKQKRATVIESKPVIFMPKATKFVPTSVRSKVAASKLSSTNSASQQQQKLNNKHNLDDGAQKKKT